MPDDALWLTISAAAARLGVTPQAIRNRIKRGTLDTQKNNRGQIMVRIDQTVDGTVPQTGLLVVPNRLETVVQKQGEEIAALREKVARLEGTDVAQRQHIEDLRAERDRLMATIDRLSAPWWRRWRG